MRHSPAKAAKWVRLPPKRLLDGELVWSFSDRLKPDRKRSDSSTIHYSRERKRFASVLLTRRLCVRFTPLEPLFNDSIKINQAGWIYWLDRGSIFPHYNSCIILYILLDNYWCVTIYKMVSRLPTLIPSCVYYHSPEYDQESILEYLIFHNANIP